MVRHFRKKSSKGRDKENNSKGSAFRSKHLLKKYLTSRHTDVVSKFLKYFENNIIDMQDKIKMPIKRLEYTMAIWRLAVIIEESLSKNDTETLLLIEQFSKRISSKDPSLQILYNIGQAGAQDTAKFITNTQLDNIIDTLCDPKLRAPSDKSDEFSNLLLMPDLCPVLETVLRDCDLGDVARLRLTMRLCQVSWEASNFSRSLDILDSVTKEYLGALTTGHTHQAGVNIIPKNISNLSSPRAKLLQIVPILRPYCKNFLILGFIKCKALKLLDYTEKSVQTPFT